MVAYRKKVVKKVTKKVAPLTIKALAKKVSTLARVQKNIISPVMYAQAATSVLLGNTTGAAITSVNLTSFVNWTRTFGTDADDEQAKKATIKRTVLQYTINTNEPDPIGYSVFVVSIKRCADDLFNAGIASMVAGTHYYGQHCNVLLNMKYFNIHYVKRFQQGSYATYRAATGAAPATIGGDQGGLSFRGSINLNYNNGKGLLINNPSGDWKASNTPKNAQQNYFLLVFCNDSTVDVESPYMAYNAIHTVHVVG